LANFCMPSASTSAAALQSAAIPNCDLRLKISFKIRVFSPRKNSENSTIYDL
jgi:hypothetical protein